MNVIGLAFGFIIMYLVAIRSDALNQQKEILGDHHFLVLTDGNPEAYLLLRLFKAFLGVPTLRQKGES